MHVDVTVAWLISVGPEYTIPYRQEKPVITVGFPSYGRVMHPVHVRGNDKIPQVLVNKQRDKYIPMIEHAQHE